MKSAAPLAFVFLLFVFTAAFGASLADVQIIDRSTGDRLPIYHHGGKMYVAGNPGARYSVQVANRTAARILAVISVDGVNVISGETASYGQSGYVFLPWQSYEITGWRKNQNEVAAFYFTSLRDSYAARTDRPQNAGVIGIAVFREQPPPQPPAVIAPRTLEQQSGATGAPATKESRRRDNAAGDVSEPRPPARSAQERPFATFRLPEKLGTGHGEREQSYVSYTDFWRATRHPEEILSIYYETRDNLVARGIIPGSPQATEPRPFPGGRFVPDPAS